MFQDQDESILMMFEEALNRSALSPSTIVNYLADLRTFLRWGQGNVDTEFSLLTINQEHIRQYRYHLVHALERATSTVNRHMMTLRKFFAFAVEAGLVARNPMKGVGLVQEEGQTVPRPLTDEEVGRLLAAATAGSRASLVRRDLTILKLLLHTGLRVSEIVSLQTQDLIFDHPGMRLRVSEGRPNGKARYLPLSKKVYKELTDYLAVRPQRATTDHLFLTQRGQPVSDRTVQRIINSCAKSAGLKGVTAQVLRRTYASRLFAETNDLAVVSERLGHQTPTITAQYLMVHELASLEERI